jgi:hypothetical protein
MSLTFFYGVGMMVGGIPLPTTIPFKCNDDLLFGLLLLILSMTVQPFSLADRII